MYYLEIVPGWLFPSCCCTSSFKLSLVFSKTRIYPKSNLNMSLNLFLNSDLIPFLLHFHLLWLPAFVQRGWTFYMYLVTHAGNLNDQVKLAFVFEASANSRFCALFQCAVECKPHPQKTDGVGSIG